MMSYPGWLGVFSLAFGLGLGPVYAEGPLSPSPNTEGTSDGAIEVSTAANSWVENDRAASHRIVRSVGIQRWQGPNTVIVTYVRLPRAGTLDLELEGRLARGRTVVAVTIGAVTHRVTWESAPASAPAPNAIVRRSVGTFSVDEPGYVAIKMQGVEKTGPEFPELTALRLKGTAVQGVKGAASPADQPYFIGHKADLSSYWGRRGPSVHWNYPAPRDLPIEWMYSEVMVPEGQDPVGSYFMANGFGQGYFGFQVNSPTERRVLFSVWSPFATDDPKAIPADSRIVALKHGDGVVVGQFGNEGAGGQSYWRYTWKAGVTYRFLLRVHPNPDQNTDYTAYFAPLDKPWKLIAQFRRPKTETWLQSPHAFVENFDPNAGHFTRAAQYRNVALRPPTGDWIPITTALFSHDDTARRKHRWDYWGGVQGAAFVLKNGGFFDEFTPLGKRFSLPPGVSQPPHLDLETLP